MNKLLIVATVLALLVAGVASYTKHFDKSPETPHHRITQAKAKIQTMNDMLHACDNNGGVIDMQERWTGGRFSQLLGTEVKCANGLGKLFEGVRIEK